MTSIQHEYYIRQPDDAEARGPFTLAQLASLVDTGGVDTRTLYFEAGSEQWIPVAGSGELGILLRGARKRKVAQTFLSVQGEDSRENSGADGGAGRDAGTGRNACATLATRFARVFLFAGAAILLWLAVPVAFGAMRQGSVSYAIVSLSLFLLGVVDVFLGAFAAVLMRRFAWVIRLRAALGTGFWGALFWLVGLAPIFGLALVVVFSVCLWLTTVLASRRTLLINAIAGLAALAGFAYCLI